MCPEIKIKHANIIIKPQATRLWCPNSLNHHEQHKSTENVFAHKNEDQDLDQHS